jgi:hypothetical protein
MNDPANAGVNILRLNFCASHKTMLTTAGGQFFAQQLSAGEEKIMYAKIRLREVKLKVKSQKSKLNSLPHF